ncbi:MAG TPA: ADOP family duplicated permease [Vicinamibacterales bacterium]|nr:ADOP family duplicated permease [Vicinamibacterales bacterium]
MLTSLAQDLRYGFRMLGRNPGFTSIAVATLALGIGLNTTLFTVFNVVALKPLPVRDAGSLMRLERWFASGGLGGIQYLFSWDEYQFLETNSHSFPELIAASNPVRVSGILPADNGAQPHPVGLVGELVSANYFSELAPNAMLGRTIAAGDDGAPGAHPVVVISHHFWRGHLSSDPAVVGKTLTLSGTRFTIVGVAAPEFIGTGNPPRIPDFWAPLAMQAQLLPGQDWRRDPFDLQLQLLGHERRVAAGPRGAAELSVLVRQFLDAHPNPNAPAGADPNTTGTAITTRVTLQPATLFGNTEDVRFRAIVTGLMTIVGMVLLIASANVANMLLARAAARRREVGVRIALGASRGRLVRQLLTESVLLALIGGAAGFVVSIWAGDLVWAAVTPFLNDTAFVVPTSPDARVFAYACLVSILAGIIFGLSPALHASRSEVVAALRDADPLAARRWRGVHVRAVLVGGQVAASVVFLACAGLLARGLVRAASATPGYATKPIYLVPLEFPGDRARASVRARGAIDRLTALPQVEDVGVVERPPMMWTWTVALRAKGSTIAPNNALANHVSGAYFRTLGIPVVRGRAFTRSEEQAGAPVAIVSEATAHALWPGADPIGQRVEGVLTRDGHWATLEVVGVVADVRTANLSRPDPAMVYFPIAESALSDNWAAIRIRGDARSAIAAIGAALAPLDARFAAGFSPLNLEDDVVDAQKLISRTLWLSATSLALLALVLTAVGIYGVAAFTASQREREMGIRMALGASATDVSRLVVRDGIKPVIVGGIGGLLGALAVSAILRAMLVFPASMDYLYGVGAFDPVTFVALPLFLALVSLAATYVPARRATRVDPIVALRHE